jgi:hypothetical protein
MAIGTIVRFPRYVKFGVDGVDGSEDVQSARSCVRSGICPPVQTSGTYKLSIIGVVP